MSALLTDKDVPMERATVLSPASYGELGDLAVELNGKETLTREVAFDAFMEWCEGRGIELWPHQEDALMALLMGDHVVLGTPTGSGKSLVAAGMCFMAACMGETSYYTAPIKALVSEKFFDLVELFGRDLVGMLTGDAQINPDAPIICCTAEILANKALAGGANANVDWVAADEFHFFADPDRGKAWQIPLLCLPQAHFLLMSATLGNMDDICALLERQTGRQVDQITDAERPVPLSYRYELNPLETTVELALRNGEGPLYLVHFSQVAALNTAQALSSYGVTSKEQRKAIQEACRGTHFSTAFGKTLKRLLASGVGVHHAGMLPRYRLLVEKLAQQGLLPVICGTDTLGVGINVPIHTVVFTALSKFDGHRTRRLRSREFHQIAGRAGRAGFDTEGLVIAEAPEHVIENERALAKAGDDPKKRRRVKRKQPPEGFVSWDESTFTKLAESVPEKLTPRLDITHSMVLELVSRQCDARAEASRLIDDSLQTPEQKAALELRATEIFTTLIDSGVVVVELPEGTPADADPCAPGGCGASYTLTVELPDDFALDQPLSPFLIEALELLDPESDTYALDVISMVEATLDDPVQILKAQRKKAVEAKKAELKAEGVPFEERDELLSEVTYEQPLKDLLDEAFALYCTSVPWANDYQLRPKSVLRAMIESANDFKSYIQAMGISRVEGILLRYLSDAYQVLDRTVPPDKRDQRLDDIVAWLGLMVRSVDSSLVDAWAQVGQQDMEGPGAFVEADAAVKDRRGLKLLVRNALIRRVTLAARDDAASLGALDVDWGYGERVWRQVLDRYYDVYDEVILDADARSDAYFELDESAEKTDHLWHVTQIFDDPEGNRDFRITAEVDLDATQTSDGVVFAAYKVGFWED